MWLTYPTFFSVPRPSSFWLRRPSGSRFRACSLGLQSGSSDVESATTASYSLVMDKDVTVQPHGLDKYKHTSTDVLLPDGPTCLTRWSKTAGAGGAGNMRRGIRCWKGSSKSPQRRGNSHPVSWEWRKGKGSLEGSLSGRNTTRTIAD